MIRRALLGLILLVPTAVSARPNVLLLVSDDQRPDTVHALGNEVIRTPHLDRLVERGTVFTRATCAHPLCVPVRAELLTGCTGFTNGVHPPRNEPNLELPTWPGVMRRAGYHTWWVGKWHIAGRPSTRGWEASRGLFASGRRPDEPQFDFAGREVTGYRGWMFQTDDRMLFPERGVGLTADISSKFADAAIEFLESKSDRNWFLQVNFTAPHDPLLIPPGLREAYDPFAMKAPPNFLPRHPFDHGNEGGRDESIVPAPRTERDVQFELAVYYAVVEDLDRQVGRILAALERSGQAENTIVVYTSDHGLAMGSHGLMGKQNMYEHTIGVPLILSGPGIPRGERRTAQCYLRDLFPTCCELCGVEVPKSVEGRSLAPVLRGETESIRPFVVGYFNDHQRMIRTNRWKFIRYPTAGRTQLFDLETDPHELRDLSNDSDQAKRIEELGRQLDEWLAARGDPLAKK